MGYSLAAACIWDGLDVLGPLRFLSALTLPHAGASALAQKGHSFIDAELRDAVCLGPSQAAG